jgi:hypothetical protein
VGEVPVVKVLADFHHHDLWESMELLCARLGWTLYRPMGMEWFTEGYWNFERAWHGDAVAKQYLVPWETDHDGLRDDLSHPGRQHRLLTLQEARDLRPDIVIASVAHNHEGFHRFAEDVGATFGLQLGNVRFTPSEMQEDRWDLAAFGLVSSVMPGPMPKPHVVYHQEFSLDDFRHEPPVEHDRVVVSSFVNCFPENPQGYATFREVAHLAQEIDWRVYGSYGQVPRDEYAALDLNRCASVGKHMRASDIAWHTKQWSDGFGHVIHNWAAVGRPLIGFQSYYQTQLAGPLWVEGVTSFDITDTSADEVRALIRSLDFDTRARMSEAMAARFRNTVDFDEEEQAIRAMFAQVLP